MKKKEAVKTKVKPKAKKVTNPKIQIDFRQLEELCKIQCTANEICAVFGLSHDTLLRRCKEKYGATFAEVQARFSNFGKASLRRIQFQLATKSAVMAIWLGKQYLGQSEEVKVDDEQWAESIEILSDEQEERIKGRMGRYMGGEN